MVPTGLGAGRDDDSACWRSERVDARALSIPGVSLVIVPGGLDESWGRVRARDK